MVKALFTILSKKFLAHTKNINYGKQQLLALTQFLFNLY